MFNSFKVGFMAGVFALATIGASFYKKYPVVTPIVHESVTCVVRAAILSIFFPVWGSLAVCTIISVVCLIVYFKQYHNRIQALIS